jgi:hypothetical protein
LEKNYFSSHKLPKQQSTNFWSQGILGVKPIIHIQQIIEIKLTPKGQSPFFGPFLEFGQATVDAIFVPKITNFW